MFLSPVARVFLFAAFCSGLLYGYNNGVYSGVMLQIKAALDLSDAELGNLIAVFDFAEIVGVIISPLADRFGRRRILMVSASALFLSPLLTLVDPPYAVLLVERALTGCAGGVTFMIGLVFVAEIAPAERRPILLSSLMVGVSAGYIAELGLSIFFVDGGGWRFAIALASIPALVQLLGLASMADSPAFLRLRGDLSGARAASRFYGLDEEKVVSEQADQVSGIRAMLRMLARPDMRSALLLGTLVVLAGTLNGASILAYGPLLLTDFGILSEARALEIILVYTVLGFGLGTLALIPIGRGFTLRLLVWSLFAIGVSAIALSAVGGVFAVLLFGAIQLAFSFGVRSTIFQILPRLLTDQTRATGVALLNLVFILLVGVNHALLPRFLGSDASSVFLVFGILSLVLAFSCHLSLQKAIGHEAHHRQLND